MQMGDASVSVRERLGGSGVVKYQRERIGMIIACTVKEESQIGTILACIQGGANYLKLLNYPA